MSLFYRTEDGVPVQQGDLVYDYYTMEPVVIGSDCGDGWFNTMRPGDPTKFSKAKMLNGSRICTLGYAKRRGFPGADVPGSR